MSATFTARLGDKKFKVPVVNGYGYYNLFPNQEVWMETLVKQMMQERPGAIIDVGVNIGQTLLKIASINSSTAYYGFEPNPLCYAYCSELVKVNALNSFNVYPVGLSSKAEVLDLYGDNEYASGASLVENFRVNTQKYSVIHRVPVMRGDDVLLKTNIETISFIKIDVEGAELEVIQGLKETLLQFKPPVIMEILPVYNTATENGKMRKMRQDALQRLLHEWQYNIYLIDESNVKLQFVEDIPVHGDMNRTNYVMLQAGQEKQFEKLLSM
ncbi:FkbM family methyltransferase [Panacibacter sp. DH6]|uniref:FkbM family methyltransferase n=1 Tax=Panacibacter microcysteis TaxID=2793269 RepID=A0A931EBL8_9BACT|nr:FkbM family methyltransferase [Panacibacter microcysteis]MBG9377626.1 FkbM family methyltransferase [Panacibacter microcysteis]